MVCTDRRLRSVAKVSFFIHDVDRLLSPRPIINTKLGDRDKADTFFCLSTQNQGTKTFFRRGELMWGDGRIAVSEQAKRVGLAMIAFHGT